MASLDKWLSIGLQSQWLSFWILFQSLKLQISRLLLARSSLTFRQLQTVYSLRMWHTVSFLSLLYFLSMFTKMLQPKSRLGPKSAPEISPDRRQTERTQVAQKTLRKNSKSKAYNNRLFHSLFILIKLIFKTVNGRRVHDI